MDSSIIDQTRARLADNLAQLETLAADDNFDPADDDVAALQRSVERDKTRLATLTRAVSERGELQKIETSLARVQSRQADEQRRATEPSGSLGDILLRSREWNDYPGYGSSGKIESGVRPEQLLTRAVSLPIKTTDVGNFDGAGIGRYLPQPDVTGKWALLNLIPTVVTSMTSFPVPGIAVTEGGAAVVAEGAEKPPLDFAQVSVDVALEMVAVYTKVTRQVLSMQDGNYIRSWIDTELRRAVLNKMAELAATALTSASIGTAAAPSGSTLTAAIRYGIAEVQAAGYNPNAVVFNPADGAKIETSLMDLNGACCTDAYWSLRPVPVPDITAGTVIVGDFSAGMATFSHTSGVTLLTTDSDQSDFIKNVLTFLAEWMAKTVVLRADAFASVSVSST